MDRGSPEGEGLMKVLGIYAGHDAAAALVVDGRIVAAAEEERYTRQKHYLGYPENAIGFVTQYGEYDKVVVATPHMDSTRWLGADYIDHHSAHAYYTYRCSGFDKTKVLVLDGGGDKFWAAVYQGERGYLNFVNGSPMEASTPFGMVYAYVTEALGFRQLHDEGKVMGLAARGNPETYSHLFEGLYLIHPDGRFISQVTPERWERLLSYARGAVHIEQKADIAAALQGYFEYKVLEWVKANVSQDEDLCVAGGVFANVKINGLLLNYCNRLFVGPAMNDGGLAAGAALAASEWTGEPQFDTCLGDDLGEPQDDPREIAQRLADGQIVGLAWGRMEYGPRALGRRSIVAPAHDPAIAQRLNEMLQRNDFMPFAPVMTTQMAQVDLEGFNWEKQPSRRHMTLTYRLSPDYKSDDYAGVVHVDGTVRPQVVTKADGWYYELVKAYALGTLGRPLINTSFNRHGEPIVRTLAEAEATAKAAGLDYLVKGVL
jgi:carbamoyltransferase